MQNVLLFSLLGLASGAMIASIALGVVLSWRASGTINIAAGAVVMVAGYLFWCLRTGHFGPALPTAPAVIITLILMALLAVVVELVAVRPLRAASPLARLVASIGVLLLMQALVQLVFGTAPLDSPAVLTGRVVNVIGVTVPVAQFILAGVVVALTAVLSVLYRFTRFGLATRAASENERAAVLAGLSPDSLSLVNAVIAYLVAGLVGVLAASVVGVSATTLPLLIVPALAAALFARFTSFAVACGVGLLIGIGEPLIFYASTKPWFPTQGGGALPGVQQVAEFLLIVVARWWRGSSLPQRGETSERSLPPETKQEKLVQRAEPVVLACAVALIVLPSDFRQAVAYWFVRGAVCLSVVCLSFVVIMGYVGQLSVVQLALAGFAAFAVSRFGTEFGLGFPLAPILS